MENQTSEEFKRKLLDINTDNPFRYPEPPPRPYFIVGGEQILKWFKDRFQQSIREGYNISFVVGEPGAGKSHLLSHLEYLFFETDSLNGIYVIYRARREEITERDLWTSLFLNDDVLKKLKELLHIDKIQNSKIRQDAKQAIIKLLQGESQIDLLTDKVLHVIAEGLSELLIEENAGMCIAIDNVDEYFRFIVEKYEQEYGKEQGRNKALASLFGTLRSVTTGLKQILLLLACTTPVYTEIENAGADRTHARRVEFQAERLKELNSNQSKVLVNKYMTWWAERHKVKLPLVKEEGCIFSLPTKEELSTYPFSETAIEYFHKVTGQFAGDIVCVCNQCINDMRTEQKIYVVKDEIIFHALEEARKRRPQLIPRIDILSLERSKILQKLMEKRLSILESQTRNRYQAGIDDATLIDAVEKYADALGISKTSPQHAKDYRDPTRLIPPSASSRVWEYKGKRIFVKYILGPNAPIGPEGKEFGYGRKIELQDIVEVISQIEDDKASHALYVRRWADTYSHATWQMSQIWRLRPVMEEVTLDKTIYKIIAASEDTSEHRKDLIEHVESFVNLRAKLDSLIEQAMHEETIEERRKKDREALAKGVA